MIRYCLAVSSSAHSIVHSIGLICKYSDREYIRVKANREVNRIERTIILFLRMERTDGVFLHFSNAYPIRIVSIKLVSRREGSFFAIYINKSHRVSCMFDYSIVLLFFYIAFDAVPLKSVARRAKGPGSVLPARLIVDYIGQSGESGQAMLIQFVLLGKNGEGEMERTRVTAISRYTRYNDQRNRDFTHPLHLLPPYSSKGRPYNFYFTEIFALCPSNRFLDSSLFPRRFRNILPPARSG